MSKRKIQTTIFVILAVIFVGVLIGTFSQPAPVNVNVTFAGYTIAPSPPNWKNTGFQFTNATFFVSNAGPARARLTFRDYKFNSSGNNILIRPSGLGILCVLKPGQSTNLIVPMIPHINGLGGFGADYSWRVEFTSRYDWLAKLDRQPKWLQSAVTKAIPQRWLLELYSADIVSDWITNREPELFSPRLIQSSH
jgi:hypothetical protein